MAKILYGVQSDGMGHALRSKPIIEHLISKGHKVKIVTSDRALIFLKKHFKDVEEIESMHFFYYNNRVSYMITVLQAIKDLDVIVRKGILKIKKIVSRFKPDIVISDFEIFSAKAANLLHVPLISIDNITIIKLAKVPYRLKNYNNYMASRIFIDSAFTHARYYFVTTFFTFPLRFKRHQGRVVFVPPILRNSIIESKRNYTKRIGKSKKRQSEKGHVLVYQTTDTNKDLLPALFSCPDEKFVFYGCNQNKKQNNVSFKKFSEKDFIRDFATAKAVITNGGFTLISEAIFLGKPILSNPIVGQYEQDLNGNMIEKLGYGKRVDVINEDNIKSFLYSLKTYRKNLSKYKQDGNKKLFSELDKRIGTILKRKSV